MPTRRRSLLPVLALTAIALAFATAAASADAEADDPRAPEATAVAAPEPRSHQLALRRVVVRRPSLGQRAARIALRAVGVPYSWGGSSPRSGFDCSGLVYWAYSHLGVRLPHSSYALNGLGRRVPRSRLRPGDVLFFSGLGHVGVYVGRGRMVHAPQSGQRVEVVRLSDSYYARSYVGARRMMRG
jgi:cell wall-associated NlpC family hydrolase